MLNKFFFFLILFLSSHSSFSINSESINNITEQKIKVSLRKVGHEILLASGDITSLVLPVEKIDNRYKISFESSFKFNPEDLIHIVDTVFKKTQIAEEYLVEIEKCETNEIVYSYEIIQAESLDDVACKTRKQPKSCYNVFITIIKSKQIESTSFLIYLLLIFMIVILFVIFYLRKKSPLDVEQKVNPNLIVIGKYYFDRRNMELILQEQKTELTSKESELLYLLYSSANLVIERDDILQQVWGDEGDYVGRTLDVFISKLRKKLSIDPNLRIVNIRGIGYKLIIND